MTLSTEFSYDHLLELASSYNLKLQAEKKSRLPFLDGATGIAQRPSNLYRSSLDRLPGVFNHQVYCYPAARWKKSKRNYFTQAAVFKAEAKTSVLTDTPVTGRGDIQDDLGLIESSTRGPDYVEFDSDDSDYMEDSYSARKRKRGKLSNTRSRGSGWSRRRQSLPEVHHAHPGPPPHLQGLGDTNGTPTGGGPTFPCSQCSAKFRSRTSQAYHWNTVHANAPPAVTEHTVVPSLIGLLAGDSNSMSSAGDSLQPPHLVPMEDPPSGYDNDDSTLGAPLPDVEVKQEDSVSVGSEINNVTKNGGIGTNCDFCFGDETLNKKTGVSEPMSRCSDCGRCAHYSCLQFTNNMISSVKKYRWQCIECKTCWLCGTSENDEKMLFCDDCDRGYHMYCLKPPLVEPPEGNWSCELCLNEYYTEAERARRK